MNEEADKLEEAEGNAAEPKYFLCYTCGDSSLVPCKLEAPDCSAFPESCPFDRLDDDWGEVNKEIFKNA